MKPKRPKSFLASEATSVNIEASDWQMQEIMAGVADTEAGKVVSHERVAKWLHSWDKSSEGKAPQ